MAPKSVEFICSGYIYTVFFLLPHLIDKRCKKFDEFGLNLVASFCIDIHCKS